MLNGLAEKMSHGQGHPEDQIDYCFLKALIALKLAMLAIG
jgi:hypothetical protein